MKNITLIYTLCLLVGYPLRTIEARVHDYETTRLKSTGGAGVGSLLINESAILNPAPIAFFTNSSIYLQKEKFEYSVPEEDRSVTPMPSNQSKSLGIIVADTKSQLHGAVSYQKQQESFYRGFDKRRRISINMASVVNKDSSVGLLYRNTTDEIHHDLIPNPTKDKYHQLIIGTTHAINEKFTVGAIIVDPFKARPQDVRAIIGGQYLFKEILALIVDVGGNYSEDLGSSRLFRGAFQLNFFKGLFLRAGLFEDRALNEKGNGFGIAWVGPRLVLEVSVKKTEDFGPKKGQNSYPSPNMTETSFALSYFF